MQNPTPQSKSNNTPATSSPSWKPVGDKSFLLQGKIVEINNKAPYALKIRLDHLFVPGPLSLQQPKFPEQVGSIVTVRFTQAFPKQGSMELKNGNEVILGVKQYATETNQSPFWGSDMSQYYYHKNGNFYGANGLQLGIPS